MSCSFTSAAETRRERSAWRTPIATAAIAATNMPIRISFAPIPVDSPENSRVSKSTEAKSAIDEAAMTSWPNREDDSPESWSTGTITPSEVEARMIAISSGSSAIPARSSTRPATTASPRETAKPSPAARNSRPRSAARSISSPARNSRKASPTRASTSTGSSTSTQPSTAGPMRIPSTISSTTDGSRSPGTRPSSIGAANPAATTISRFSNEISIPPVCRGGMEIVTRASSGSTGALRQAARLGRAHRSPHSCEP